MCETDLDTKNLPRHSRTTPEGWARACSPMTSPWWSLHSVTENQVTGQRVLFFFFSAIFKPPVSFFLILQSPIHPRFLPRTSSQEDLECPHVCGPRTAVLDTEQRVWPCQRGWPALPMPYVTGFLLSSAFFPPAPLVASPPAVMLEILPLPSGTCLD